MSNTVGGPSKWFQGYKKACSSGMQYYAFLASNGGGCSGYARGFLTGKYEDTNDQDAIAWGYEGTGPLYCAASIIYHTLNGTFHTINIAHYSGKLSKECRLTNGQVKLANRFMSKVVAKLPDDWKMTADEVKQWIKDGTLPDCIKQTKTKG